MMNQLIVNGITLPNVKGGRYTCYEDVLSESIEMISGRMVEEVRGIVYVVEYSTGADGSMENSLYQSLIPILRSGKSFPVQVLPDNRSDVITSTFICTERPKPMMIMEHLGEPVWANISFTLREVYPHA